MIDPRTKAGLYEAIELYWGAIEDCNAKNGFGVDGDTAVPVGVLVAPVAVPAPTTKTTIEKVTTKPTGVTTSPVLPSPVDVVKDLVRPSK